MTMEKKKSIADWMNENGLTLDSLAKAIDYSHGAAAKWRQDIVYPDKHAQKEIKRVGRRKGWTPLPERGSWL